MDREKAQAEIDRAEVRFRKLQAAASELQKVWWKEASAAKDRAVSAISKKFEAIYARKCKAAQVARDAALACVTTLKVKHAAALCGLPIRSVMVEWVQDWEGWRPTGRTGSLEVCLDGTEWPADFGKPAIGTVIVRVNGKNGKPTRQAAVLSRTNGDMSFRKYVWLPEGKKPKEATN